MVCKHSKQSQMLLEANYNQRRYGVEGDLYEKAQSIISNCNEIDSSGH